MLVLSFFLLVPFRFAAFDGSFVIVSAYRLAGVRLTTLSLSLSLAPRA